MIQVYTGDGKGKTTAALGLSLRAAGAGKRVYICQFLKKRFSSESAAIKRLQNITLEQFGTGCFIREKPSKADIKCACEGIDRVKEIISAGNFDLVVMDEINVVLHLGLVPLPEVLSLFRRVPSSLELVLTGRDCPLQVIAKADMVSEIKDVKHYYREGRKARKGIEF